MNVPEEHALTVFQVQEELPDRLLTALERRWYDGFDASRAVIEPHLGGDIQAESRFLHILELAHGEDVARSLHWLNMQNVISSFGDGSHSLAFALRGDVQRVGMYFGVRRYVRDQRIQTTDYVDVLRRTLRSNFPGIVLSRDVLSFEQCQAEILDPVTESRYLACLTGIPSLKQDAAIHFTQSLDRLVDGLRGESYALLVLAEPICEATLTEAMRRCRRLSEDIHALVRRSIAAFQSQSTGTGTTSTRATSITAGSGALLGMLFGVSLGRSWQTGVTDQRGRSAGLTVTQEALNKTAEFCEKLLDHYVARLQNGRNLGFWNVGLYVASPDFNTLLRAQGIVRGLFAGKDTHLEPLRVLDLSQAPVEVKDALAHLRNPGLDSRFGLLHPLGEEFQKLASPLTTEELSLLISLPRREVPGVKLTPVADFGVNPPVSDGVSLGRVVYRGDTLDQPMHVDSDTLTQHAFITGITGGGKTNTCLVLLQEAYLKRGVPFLVIEPAKTEYRVLMADDRLRSELQIFTLGDDKTAPFRLNPFEFVRGFNLLTHIDFLKAVFNASFPMYASMPYILEEAVLEVYTDRGWDIASSANRFVDARREDYTPYLPTLEDLYNKIDTVVQRKHYAAQLTLDISAALKARLQSLLNGGKGLMFNTQRTVPLEQLLNRPTVLELRHVGDDDEKAFLMALLLALIYEHCQVNRFSSHLQHLTLIEEAHRLLKNIPPSVSLEVGNARGKAVEMFTDILAEIREYGEGFIIVDQIPSKLVPDAIKNTSLKILHRLVADDDRRFVGNAMGLNEEQKEHVVRLRPGEAVIHSAGLDKPILTKIRAAKDDLKGGFQTEIGIDKLKEQMAQTRRANAEVYRRWPGCHVCDDPCTYLSQWNHPDDVAIGTFRRLSNILLHGDLRVCLDTWTECERVLRQHLQPRYRSRGWSEGVFTCHFVQLSRRLVLECYDYYRNASDGHSGVVELQQQVMGVIQALHSGFPEELIEARIEALRATMWERLACRPAKAQPGCKLCRRQCRFGYLVQRLVPPEPSALAGQIQEANRDPAFRNNYRRLVRLLEKFALRTTGIRVTDSELPHLGYCYLANSTAKEHVLAGYQKWNRG